SGPGNINVPSTGGTDVISFIVDSTSPTITLTWPAANAAVSSSTVQMTGTDGDDAGGSGVNLIQVEISTGLAGSKVYWNGASWQAGQLWITTTTVNPWIYTIPNSALAPGNGKLYYLRIQANDFAGKLFTSQTSTFTYNTTAPTVTITPQAPNNGFYSAVQVSTPLAGTTSPSGAPGIVVSTVSLMLQDLTFPTSYFNGSAWQNGSTSFAAQGTVGSWSFNSASLSFVNDRQYQLTATATDNSQVANAASSIFVYDVQKPTSSITSPAPGYVTANPLTTLSGKANDQINNPTFPSGLASTAVGLAIQQVG